MLFFGDETKTFVIAFQFDLRSRFRTHLQQNDTISWEFTIVSRYGLNFLNIPPVYCRRAVTTEPDTTTDLTETMNNNNLTKEGKKPGDLFRAKKMYTIRMRRGFSHIGRDFKLLD